MTHNSVFNAKNIEQDLDTCKIGRHCLVFEQVDSTNDIAAKVAGDRQYDGLAVFAEYQRSGRGRNGHAWVSEPGQSLLCSVLVFIQHTNGSAAGMVSMAGALAAVQAIDGCFDIDAGIKWPNDIYCRGKKIGGILIESRGNQGTTHSYVIGIGINVLQRQEQFPPELRATAASIASIADLQLGQEDRLALARGLLKRLDHRIQQVRDGQGKALRKDWISHALGTAQTVTISHQGRKIDGRIIDIDQDLQILVQGSEGLMVRLEAGRAKILL